MSPRQQQEEHQVGQGGGHPDAAEADQLAEQAAARALFLGSGGRREGAAGQGRAQFGDGDAAGDQVPAEPGHAAEVGQGCLDDVDAGIGIVGPVHRNFVDAQSASFGEDQQLRVEEPGVVHGVREDLLGDIGADGLEAALGIAEVGAHEDCSRKL